MSIFSQNSGFRRAGLGSLAVTNKAPSPFAPPSACDSAGDADKYLASKASAPRHVGVGKGLEERDGTRLKGRDGTDDAKTYRPPAFEGSEDVSELMSL